MERRIDDQRPSAPLEWEAKHAAMDRAGELPLERRVAERRKEPPALVTVMAETVAKLTRELATSRNDALEEAAKACDAMESDMFDQYKGRGKHAPNNESRADPYMNGQSDGAGQCAAAIRALASQPAAPVQPAWGKCVWCDAPSTTHDRSCSAPDGDGHMFKRTELAAPPVQQPGDVRGAAAPTRVDVMSLIRSQMHRVYASAIDREDIDTKYMREIEDAIMGIYHGRYIAGYDLRKSEDGLATTRPSAALTEKWLRAAKESAHHLAVWLEQDDCDCEPEGHHCGKPLVQATLHDLRAILAASSGAVAVPEGGA